MSKIYPRKSFWVTALVVTVFACATAFGWNAANASENEMNGISGIRIQPCDWNGKGSFIDARDGKEYRQVQIGGKCWMASNLNFGKVVKDMEQYDNHIPECTCYQNEPDNCTRLGGLYTWDEAMAYVRHQDHCDISGLCPDGWHLPSDEEWTAMEKFLDPTVDHTKHDWRGTTLANFLVAAKGDWVTGLKETSSIGFEALPAGNAVSGWFFYLGRGAYFWTSSSYSAAAAWSRGILSQTAQVYRGPGDKLAGFSVRCIKN